MLKYVGIILLTIGISYSANATQGCVRNDDLSIIYTGLSGGKYGSPTANVTPGCSFILTATTCTVKIGSTNYAGKISDTTPQNCPIDDSIYISLIILSVLGAYLYHNQRPLQPTGTR